MVSVEVAVFDMVDVVINFLAFLVEAWRLLYM